MGCFRGVPRGSWIAVLAGMLVTASAVTGQAGLYTEAQAASGQALYDAQCASCHGGLRDFAPGMAALLGDHTFRATWAGRPLGELFGRIQETMPQDDPGSLTVDDTAAVVAYILSGNGFPAGASALSGDLDALMAIPFDPGR